MELETKVLSRELQQRMYDNGLTIGTAESCTGVEWQRPSLPRQAHRNISRVA